VNTDQSQGPINRSGLGDLRRHPFPPVDIMGTFLHLLSG
jgi:hypothetical protein